MITPAWSDGPRIHVQSSAGRLLGLLPSVLLCLGAVLGAGLSLGACGGADERAGAKAGQSNAEPERDGSKGSTGPRLRVVATVGMISDVARRVSAGRADVLGLMGEGVDPHLYKASPGDVRAMSDADLILYNGLHLEGRMADVIVKMAGRVGVVRVTDEIDESALRQPAEFEGHFDPHVWFDVGLWSKVSERIVKALSEKDPAGKAAYQTAGREYAELLKELDAYARASFASIPQGSRVLVTAHDAFGYLGAAYGLEVHAIQGISTDSEASLQDINALVDMLTTRKVPAVFVESSVPRKTIDALVEGCAAREHAIVVGGELFSDALGRQGTIEGTYVGMVLHNVATITRALGGDAQELPARLRAHVASFAAGQPAPHVPARGDDP